MPRTLVALGLAAALAGCGSATTGSGQAAAGASAGAAPLPSTGGGAFDAQVAERPSGSAAAGTVIQQHRQRISAGAQASITTTAQHVSAPAGAAGSLSSDPALNVKGPGASGPAAGHHLRHPPAHSVPPAATQPPSTIAIHTQPPRRSTPTRTVQRTVTVTHTRTVVHTVTVSRSVRPDVPSTAFLPSRHPALAQTSFTVAGGNIGCAINALGVRCELVHRVWAAPLTPARCRAAWGDTIALQARGRASFACGGRSPLSPDAKVIPDGWDDKIGRMTCQVRGIGVDCFSTRHHGFMISRTGYALY